MSAKELILHTARNLFNQYGTARVTTNHIAKEAGISPGNLYYHYRDKPHIIREIYEQMIQEWESVYDRIKSKGISMRTLQDFIEDNFDLLWQYRYFYRETVALLNADSILYERHIEVSKQRFRRQRLILQRAIHEGVLRFPEPEIQLDEALTIAWIISCHYLNYLESMGQKVEKTDFETGAGLVMAAFRPYMK